MSTLPDPQPTTPIIQSTDTNSTDDVTDVPVITNDLPVSQNIQAAPNDNLIGQMQKEQEPIAKTENQTLQDLMPEMNISPELTNIGIEKISETINLPSDLKKTKE